MAVFVFSAFWGLVFRSILWHSSYLPSLDSIPWTFFCSHSVFSFISFFLHPTNEYEGSLELSIYVVFDIFFLA